MPVVPRAKSAPPCDGPWSQVSSDSTCFKLQPREESPPRQTFDLGSGHGRKSWQKAVFSHACQRHRRQDKKRDAHDPGHGAELSPGVRPASAAEALHSHARWPALGICFRQHHHDEMKTWPPHPPYTPPGPRPPSTYPRRRMFGYLLPTRSLREFFA